MNTPLPPFFTIITATYNAAETLPMLLHSLEEQTCQDFVWVCQDGASNDNTMDIVGQWKDKISVSVESCRDSGIYDAWNKALKRERKNLGEWVLFLGADDLLAGADVLDRIKDICTKSPDDVLFVAGDLEVFDSNFTVTEKLSVDSKKCFKQLLHQMVPHPALFSRKRTFKDCLFDTSFKIAGDFDWIQKTWQKHEQLTAANILVSKMSNGGISNDKNMLELSQEETQKIFYRYFFCSLRRIPHHLIYVLNTWRFLLKMACKKHLQKFSLGKKVWTYMQNIRKKF